MNYTEWRTPMVDHGVNPCSIPDEDPLLQKLLEIHGDRRYEVLDFKKGEKK